MITTELAGGYIILCLLAGVAAALLLYYKDKRLNSSGKSIRYSLAFIRFLSVSLLAFLLLSPYISSQKQETEAPTVIYLQDNSESMQLNTDSSQFRSEFDTQFQAIKEGLSDDYQLRSYAFGENIQETEKFSFADKKTDIATAFQNIDLQFNHQNVGAIVLASDGLYNVGNDPRYALPHLNVPIYTLALGDSSLQKDLAISRVLHNKLSYLGNDFPVEIKLKAEALQGKQADLKVRKGKKIVFEKSIDISDALFSESISFFLPAEKAGVQEYLITLDQFEEEKNVENNRYKFSIDVLDNRRKILLLAQAAHPDINAIRQAIEQQDEYEFELAFINDFDGELDPYHLVILHQVPAGGKNGNRICRLLQEKQIPTWFVLGSKNQISQFNKSQQLLSIQKSAGQTEESFPLFNEQFDLFTSNTGLAAFVEFAPPLTGPYGQFTPSANAQHLFQQRIGTVATDKPLLSFGAFDKRKVAVLAGEGLWRWRIYDYEEHENHALFDELISKTVQYLSATDDKRRFRIQADRHYNETQSIVLEAELYNSSYESINTNDVFLELFNEQNEQFDYRFSPAGNHYKLNIGKLPAGRYQYKAYSDLNDEHLALVGSFYVDALQLEASQTRADHQLLRQLSEKTGGQLFTFGQTDALVNTILANEQIKPVMYEKWDTNLLLDTPWYLACILLLLALEWFLRKRAGTY